MPTRYGKPDTIARYYRRLTHAGPWQNLLRALLALGPGHPLRWIEAFIFKACRRAHPILGLVLIRGQGPTRSRGGTCP
ncbi:hypothetical protein [Humitalea rosea]|uniref:hypothetical protein n=1 Tax=Humitalea rosea TaxID=990373 RepID=UPI0013147A33|nr:hypothetical protein [Humitalea rosea]